MEVTVMRAKRKSVDEQYELIMQCRSSGLSDYQWCNDHDSIEPAPVCSKGAFVVNGNMTSDSAIEIAFGSAVIKISNAVDSLLLAQVIHYT
jgi:hypothetical protein